MLANVVEAADELDPTALAATARVDLRLHDPEVATERWPPGIPGRGSSPTSSRMSRRQPTRVSARRSSIRRFVIGSNLERP